MIQLATDPKASRTDWRPAPDDTREQPLAARRERSGHAWPFISRHAERPAGQPGPQRQSGDSGS